MLTFVEQIEAVRKSIIYEQKGVMAVNKPAGITTHGHPEGVTESVVRITGENYCHVHQLDRDTSGVLLLGVDRSIRGSLQNQFRQREVKKTYLALVDGIVPVNQWQEDSRVANKEAFTRFQALADLEIRSKRGRTRFLTLVEAKPLTGRTHQIRIHLAAGGYPIMGDRLYNPDPSTAPRQMLHALKLECFTPGSREPLSIVGAIPADFQAVLDRSRITPRVPDFRIPTPAAA